jgi:RNA polymerase sigma factor (sigma-70 family)
LPERDAHSVLSAALSNPYTAAAPRAPLSNADVRALEPVLMGFAYRAVRDHDRAQELVQETYIAALEAYAGFEGRSSLRTWMVGILSRKIIDHYRRTRREVLTDVMPEPEPSMWSAFFRSSPRAPDADIDPKRAVDVMDAAMASLRELERMAILLCDIEELDRDEACNALGIQPTNLRVLLHRGRTKLRKALENAHM